MGDTDRQSFDAEWAKALGRYEGLYTRFSLPKGKPMPEAEPYRCELLTLNGDSNPHVDKAAMQLISGMTSDDKCDIVMRALFGDEWSMSDDPLAETTLGNVAEALRKREDR